MRVYVLNTKRILLNAECPVTCFFDGIGARKGVEYACRGHVIDLFPFKLFACLRICDLPAIHDEQLINSGHVPIFGSFVLLKIICLSSPSKLHLAEVTGIEFRVERRRLVYDSLSTDHFKDF